MDTTKFSIEEYSLSEENHRLLQEILLNYAWEMKKNGRADITVETVINRFKLLAKYCNILNPEEVKATLAKLHWANSTKMQAVWSLTPFYKFNKIEWGTIPEYQKEEKLPFIPTEEEINILIASAGKTYKALLQLLKETGMRIGEAMLLKWTDYDAERKVISVTPLKGSKPRVLPISETLKAMLGMLPKENERIFPKKNHSYRVTFEGLRNRLAKQNNKPRLKKIHFHTFRHFKGTMEYHKTKDVVHVKNLLGHRDIESTMVYINIEQALFLNTTDEYHCKTAKTTEEAVQLIEAGFEYITEMDNLKLFRKRK